MKKSLFVFFAGAVFFPLISFGAITYSRVPAGSVIVADHIIPWDTAQLDISVGFDSVSENPCATWDSLDYWGIAVNEYGQTFNSVLVASDTLASTFHVELPVGEYTEVLFACGNSPDTPVDWLGELEGGGASPIFSVVSAPAITRGFTYGEIINSIFLFLILTILSSIAFQLYFGRIKIKN